MHWSNGAVHLLQQYVPKTPENNIKKLINEFCGAHLRLQGAISPASLWQMKYHYSEFLRRPTPKSCRQNLQFLAIFGNRPPGDGNLSIFQHLENFLIREGFTGVFVLDHFFDLLLDRSLGELFTILGLNTGIEEVL